MLNDFEYDYPDEFSESDTQEEVELVFDLLIHTTEKAFLLQFGVENVWLPKSMAIINMSMHRNTVVLPRWLMVKNGLEYYITEETLVPREKTHTEGLFNKFAKKNKKEEEDKDIPF